jgi:hypothetical protein
MKYKIKIYSFLLFYLLCCLISFNCNEENIKENDKSEIKFGPFTNGNVTYDCIKGKWESESGNIGDYYYSSFYIEYHDSTYIYIHEYYKENTHISTGYIEGNYSIDDNILKKTCILEGSGDTLEEAISNAEVCNNSEILEKSSTMYCDENVLSSVYKVIEENHWQHDYKTDLKETGENSFKLLSRTQEEFIFNYDKSGKDIFKIKELEKSSYVKYKSTIKIHWYIDEQNNMCIEYFRGDTDIYHVDCYQKLGDQYYAWDRVIYTKIEGE